MRLDYYIVLMKDPGRPIRVSAKSFIEFMEELGRIVERFGPFELIYRG